MFKIKPVISKTVVQQENNVQYFIRSCNIYLLAPNTV
uniref:Uncharacterized protein n=1 Tax=Anguilla anguilla TaxID=7936 RepID=A0A0E9S6X1_ANGAN